jgi:hypothetical protein
VSDVNLTKLVAYLAALAILAATYYALVLYPFALDADIKLWLTGLSGSAATLIFSDQVASRTARQGQAAYDKGVQTPSVTATGGDPPTVTVTPPETTPAAQG